MIRNFLRRLWVVGVSGLVVGAVEAAPRVEFDRTVYDFGVTSMVQSVTGKFIYTNTGDAELKLQRAAPTCGCTVAGMNPDTLQPGEKGELTFTFSLAGIRGRSQKYINVPTNDPANPNVRLTIQVEVTQTFETTPQFVNFGLVPVGTTTNQIVEVRRVDGKPLKVVKAESAQPQLTAQIEQVDDVTARLTIELAAAGAPRRLAELIQVYTDDSGPTAALGVQVTGQIVGDVVVQPERLIWGIGNFERLPASQLERALTRSVRITLSRPEEKLELRDVASTLKDLDVQIIPLEDGRSYMVQARFPSIPAESANGVITIATNLKAHPTLEIPVTINVLRR